MSTHLPFNFRLSAGLIVAGWVTSLAACGGSGGKTNTGPDATVVDGAVPDADQLPDTGTDSGTDSGIDSGTDSGTALGYTTCKTLKDADPSLVSGIYDVDFDGDEGESPTLAVYCDMTFDGGGWTLIQSYTGTTTPAGLTAEQGNAGFLLALPRHGSLGALAGWVVQELTQRSTQVHIRYSFEADAASADPDTGRWITSRAPENAEVTVPMENLRNLDVMSKGTNGGYADWTGPQATATKLSWVPGTANCLNLTNARKYPSVLWSCGNFESLNIISERVSFRWNDNTNQPLEVYVR